MKKSLFAFVMLGALASSSMAILQIDVPMDAFPAGHGTEAATFTLFGNPTAYPQTGFAGPDGFPLAYHLLFDYDASIPGGALNTMSVSSGTCTRSYTFPMFTQFYQQGPAFPVYLMDGQVAPFTSACYSVPCTPGCALSATSLDFGTVIHPAPVSQTFTITNTSTGDNCPPVAGSITEACGTFSVSPNSYSLAAGQSVTVTVTFTGDHSGQTSCAINTGCGTVSAVVNDIVAAEEAPVAFSLAEAYPNPFNPTTTIAYSVPENQNVTLNVYNTTGQLVQTLVNGMVERGEHKVVFDASSLSSGVYVYTLQTANETAMQKMVLVK